MLKLWKRADSPHWQIAGTLRGVRVRESTGTDSRGHAEAILARRQQEILDRAVYGEAATATFAEAVNLYLDLGGFLQSFAPLAFNRSLILDRLSRRRRDAPYPASSRLR